MKQVRKPVRQDKRKKITMKEHLRKYKLFFNQARIGLVIGTTGGNVLELMNPYFAEMHGYTVEELTNRPVADVFAPECRSILPAITEYIHQVGHYSFESKHIRKDGSIFPVLVSSHTVYDKQKKAKYRIVNVVDLTEIKKNEQRIKQLDDHANTLARTALTINAELDLKEVLKNVCREVSTCLKSNCATIRLLDAETQSFRLLFTYGEKLEQFASSIPMVLFNRYLGGTEQVSVIKDINTIDDPTFKQFFGCLNLKTLVAIKLYNGQEIFGAIMLFRFGEVWAVSEEEVMLMQGLAAQASLAIRNAQLYSEIRDNREKLHELHGQVLQTQEEERRRISRELHDELGQALTGLKIKLELVADTICLNCTAKAKLDDIISLADETLELTRQIAYDLRPPGLETVGLKAVLRDYCRTFAQRVGITVTFTSSEAKLPLLSETGSISLYRVLQEALTNVAKHAKASGVNVRLQTDAEFLSLLVQDDGIGSDSSAPPQVSGEMGLGIMGMRERLEALGGHLKIKNTLGKGFELTAQFPWEGLQ